MKYCPKCGTPNEEMNKFCTSCGTTLPMEAERSFAQAPAIPPSQNVPPVSQNQYGNPNYSQAPQNIQPTNYSKGGYNYQQSPYYKQPSQPGYTNYAVQKKPLSSNPAVNAIKTVLSSGLMIAMAIIYSCGLLFNAYNSIDAFNTQPGDASAYIEQFDLEEYGDLFDALNIGAMVEAIENYANILNITTLISLIPSILFCIGLWLVFMHAGKRDTDTMQQSGLKLLMVTTILTGLTTIISTILIIPSFIDADAGDYIIGIMALTVIISIIFVIAYILMILRFIYSVLTTIKTGVPSLKGAMFVAVVSFIVGVSSLFSLELLSSAFTILLGFVVLLCRSKLNKLAYVNPYAQGAQGAQFAQAEQPSQYTYSDDYQKQLDAYNQSRKVYESPSEQIFNQDNTDNPEDTKRL